MDEVRDAKDAVASPAAAANRLNEGTARLIQR
jgi:hypothetical protein